MAGRHTQKKKASRADRGEEAASRWEEQRVYITPERYSSGGGEYDFDYEAEPDYDDDWDDPDYGRYVPEEPRRGRVWLWLLPVFLVLLAAAGGWFFVNAYGDRVAAMDTIYPNVTVNGVDLGGLTVTQAMDRLAAAGADPYRGKSLTVHFPLDRDMTVTAAELGLGADLSVPAEAAYAYGRGGTKLDNALTYYNCKNAAVPMVWEAKYAMDENTLRQKIDAVAAEVNTEALDSTAQIRTDGIALVKGMSAKTVDAGAVFVEARQAFLDMDYTDLSCEFIETEPTGQEKADDEALLRKVYETIYAEPKNAMYDKSTGGIAASAEGVSFDMEEAMRLWTDAAPGAEVFIPYVFTEPEVDEEDLTRNLFADCLAEKSTSLSGSSSDRINNITLAAQAMNGTVVNPGETFDYNSCLGERTTAKGYREAGAYSGGRHVTDVGGGICQGSSTLYYCALYANLNITVRSNHYFAVGYLPWGMDATVSWGGPDFRFVNSRDYPIKLSAWVSDGELTVQIWGTDDGTYVDITSETWEDSECYYAQTYRYVYAADGTLLSSGAEAYSNYHKYEAGDETPPPQQQTYEQETYYEPEQDDYDPEPYYEPEQNYEPEPEPDPTPPPAPEEYAFESEGWFESEIG